MQAAAVRREVVGDVLDFNTLPIGARGTTPWKCPECESRVVGFEQLGAHIERHRPVFQPEYTILGKHPKYNPCKMKCGRWFLKGRRGMEDFNAHARVCDGSLPL